MTQMLIRILALVMGMASIIMLIAGMLFSNSDNFIGSYILIAGIVLSIISALFITGAVLTQSKPLAAAKVIIIASALYLLASLWPVFQMYNFSMSWQGTVLTTVIWLVVASPFLWISFYLWRREISDQDYN